MTTPLIDHDKEIMRLSTMLAAADVARKSATLAHEEAWEALRAAHARKTIDEKRITPDDIDWPTRPGQPWFSEHDDFIEWLDRTKSPRAYYAWNGAVYPRHPDTPMPALGSRTLHTLLVKDFAQPEDTLCPPPATASR